MDRALYLVIVVQSVINVVLFNNIIDNSINIVNV